MFFIKKDTEKNTVANNYFALLLIQVINFALPIIIYPYLVRTIKIEKYGLIMIGQSLAVFFTLIVDFGFNTSGTRQVAVLKKNNKNLSKLFWNIFLIKAILLVFTFVVLIILIITIPRFTIENKVYLYSFLIVVGQAIFPTWFFQGIEKMRIITYFHLIAKLLFTISLFLFVLNPGDYEFVPLLNGLSIIFASVIGFIISLKYVSFIFPSFKETRSIVIESFPLFISNFAVSLYTSANTFILGMISGNTLAGVYSSMEKLILALKSIYTPIYQSLFPNLSRKSDSYILSFVKTYKKFIYSSGLLIFLFVFFFSNEILIFFYNDDEITSYADVLKILSIIVLFASINMFYLSLIFTALKKYYLRMYILITTGIFNLIMVVVNAYFFNIYGVAVSVVLSELLMVILSLYYFRKLKIKYNDISKG